MNIQNQFREYFKKSDSLKKLKEVHANLDEKNWISFCDRAMKSAYDCNRSKAVEYMLSFYDWNKPQLILIFQLEKMLKNDNDLIAGEKMLRVILKNFSPEKCYEIINTQIKHSSQLNQEKTKERSIQITKIILEEVLSKENDLKILKKQSKKL